MQHPIRISTIFHPQEPLWFWTAINTKAKTQFANSKAALQETCWHSKLCWHSLKDKVHGASQVAQRNPLSGFIVRIHLPSQKRPGYEKYRIWETIQASRHPVHFHLSAVEDTALYHEFLWVILPLHCNSCVYTRPNLKYLIHPFVSVVFSQDKVLTKKLISGTSFNLALFQSCISECESLCSKIIQHMEKTCSWNIMNCLIFLSHSQGVYYIHM